jgi:hypothetical protein
MRHAGRFGGGRLGEMISTDPAALIASTLTRLPPEEQGVALADLLRAYVRAWHRCDPSLPPEEIGRRFAAEVREALALLAAEEQVPAPRLQ